MYVPALPVALLSALAPAIGGARCKSGGRHSRTGPGGTGRPFQRGEAMRHTLRAVRSFLSDPDNALPVLFGALPIAYLAGIAIYWGAA